MKIHIPDFARHAGKNTGSHPLQSALVHGLRLLTLAALVVPAVLPLKVSATDVTLYWDTDPGTAGLGGSGNWNATTDANWSLFTGGTGPNIVWQNPATSTDHTDAVFDGTAGTVTINAGFVQVRKMTFNVDGYTLFRPLPTTNEIRLESDSSITVTNATDRAIISAELADSANGAGPGVLRLTGPGIVQLNGNPINTYTGGTFVDDGLLELNKVFTFFAFNRAIPGDLTIGDGIGGADTAIVRNLTTAQIANNGTLTVTVNKDGLYDVNDLGEIIDKLVIKDGHVRTGTSAVPGPTDFLRVTAVNGIALDMTGGLIEGTAPLELNGDLVATSGSTAVISAPVDLFGATRTFTVNAGDKYIDLRIDGVIFDSIDGSGITKEGNGKLALTAVNTYTGNTTVNNGVLILDGELNSRIDVTSANGPATLEGTGIAHRGVHIESGAFFYPINRFGIPGTFTMDTFHDFTMESPNATFIAGFAGNVQGVNTSLLNFTNTSGEAWLNGGNGGPETGPSLLSVARVGGFVPGNLSSFQIITTAGPTSVHGIFGNTFTKTNGIYGIAGNGDGQYLNNANNGFWLSGVPLLVKVDNANFSNGNAGTNNVTLDFVADFVDFFGSGLTPNQNAVATALDNSVLSSNATVQSVINFIVNNPSPGTFDLVAPEELTALFQIGISGANVQNANILGRCEDLRLECGMPMPVPESDGKATVDAKGGKNFVAAPTREPGQRWGFFINGSGEFTKVDGDGNGSAYDFRTAGVTVGADYRVNEHFVLGLFGGYANTDVNLVNDGRIDANSGKGGLFATWCDSGFYADAIVSGGYTSYDTRRIGLPQQIVGNPVATGSTDGTEFSALLGGGYDFHQGAWTFGPFANAQYTDVHINDFTENGSLAPLHVDSHSEDSLRSQVGVRATVAFKVGGVTLRPSAHAAWQHEFQDQALEVSSEIAGSSTGFTVSGPKVGRDSAVVGAGLAIDLTPRLTIYTAYQGDLGRGNYSQHSVFGGIVFKF